MIERDKVIEILEKAKTVIEQWIPMFWQYNTPAGIDDAISLLKEQEAVEPTVSGAEEHDGLRSWWYQCGKCKMPIEHGDRFCRHCGQEVKWERKK